MRAIFAILYVYQPPSLCQMEGCVRAEMQTIIPLWLSPAPTAPSPFQQWRERLRHQHWSEGVNPHHLLHVFGSDIVQPCLASPWDGESCRVDEGPASPGPSHVLRGPGECRQASRRPASALQTGFQLGGKSRGIATRGDHVSNTGRPEPWKARPRPLMAPVTRGHPLAAAMIDTNSYSQVLLHT